VSAYCLKGLALIRAEEYKVDNQFASCEPNHSDVILHIACCVSACVGAYHGVECYSDLTAQAASHLPIAGPPLVSYRHNKHVLFGLTKK
jgi:hypothetical protein